MVSRRDFNFFRGTLQKGCVSGQGPLSYSTSNSPSLSLSLPPPSLTIYLKSPCLSVPVSLTCVCLCFPLFSISVSFCVSLSLCVFLYVCLSLSLFPLPLSFLPSPSLPFKTLVRTCSKIQETITFTHDAPHPISRVLILPWLCALRYPTNSFPGGGEGPQAFLPFTGYVHFKKDFRDGEFHPKEIPCLWWPSGPWHWLNVTERGYRGTALDWVTLFVLPRFLIVWFGVNHCFAQDLGTLGLAGLEPRSALEIGSSESWVSSHVTLGYPPTRACCHCPGAACGSTQGLAADTSLPTPFTSFLS